MSGNSINEDIGNILGNIEGVSTIECHDDLKKEPEPYFDKYLTREQQKRDAFITSLLEFYVVNYKKKTESNHNYKKILFFVNIGIIILFTIMIMIGIGIAGHSINKSKNSEQLSMPSTEIVQENFSDKTESYQENENYSTEFLVTFITACVSYLTLVFGILTIITNYVFPKKEEEYITQIVKIIQKNDLKNKRENMRVDGVEVIDNKNQRNGENIVSH